jgi:hypothetical protein
MRITGPINPAQPMPLQAAKAYGLQPPRPTSTEVAGMIRPTTRRDAVNLSPGVQNLVAGAVSQSASFDAPAVTTTPRVAVPGHVLQMYTRAADRVEAAVAVQHGRTIDLKA